jgi:Ca2+-binding RTX toxin-like protein
MLTRRDRRARLLSARRLLGVGLAVTAVVAAAPSAAQAATAFVNQSCNGSRCVSRAVFSAGPGEVNQVRLTYDNQKDILIRDSQHRIAAGAGCVRHGFVPPRPASEGVECRPRRVKGTDEVGSTVVLLGDQGDTVISYVWSRLSGGLGSDYVSPRSREHSRAVGGAGNDVVSSRLTKTGQIVYGGTGNDRVYGGAGNDRVSGNAGDDIVSAGNGRDSVGGGSSGNDRVNGNAGADRVRGGNGNDIVDGGRDNDRVTGQSGNDLVIGGPGNDRLVGRSGRDRLRGGFGRDLLRGGTGRDRYRGGPGGDGINAVDNIRERVNCGTGRDFAAADRRPRDIVAFCNVVKRI